MAEGRLLLTKERLRLLAAGAILDLTACAVVFWIRPPFLGDGGEYLEFLKFLPRAFLAVWIGGRIGTAWLTLRLPKALPGYVLACAATVILIAGWAVLGTTGWTAHGIGEFTGWRGLGSAAGIFGLLLEPGWRPSWIRRIAGPSLLVEIGLLSAMFVVASTVTRRALKPAG